MKTAEFAMLLVIGLGGFDIWKNLVEMGFYLITGGELALVRWNWFALSMGIDAAIIAYGSWGFLRHRAGKWKHEWGFW